MAPNRVMNLQFTENQMIYHFFHQIALESNILQQLVTIKRNLYVTVVVSIPGHN